MSEESSQDQQILKIPLYCYHSKPFLVEELALEESYQNLHYGRCCVIGRLAQDSTDSSNWFLENIRLPSLPKKYSLPEGTINLLLSIRNFRRSIPNGKICEIIGECILNDTTIDKTASKIPLTSKDITEKLNYLSTKSPQCVLEYKTFLLTRYKPAISVDDIKVLERGHELAERNIEIRMLSKK
ncbi:uncharacterized protein LOC129916219 [Episyrphus balteatus]|uniref:uncharacterized protein LOC129916219 n=1 Tax=Episyrphus balteatus TaxID=286459 RepID=UPI0024852FAC|nr:uncharacterized protein LOC129916219 [Episyrphus balteatus]